MMSFPLLKRLSVLNKPNFINKNLKFKTHQPANDLEQLSKRLFKANNYILTPSHSKPIEVLTM